ncbi:unnamed protein product, partial [Rotaria magnacalcarata]
MTNSQVTGGELGR